MLVRKERRLPLLGQVIASVGQKVVSSDLVARTELPGNVELINIVNKLGCDPKDIKDVMKVEEGAQVKKGDCLAESSGFFGWFKNSLESPKDGTIEKISNITGQVVLREPPMPVSIDAYIDGTIESILDREGVVVKTMAAFVQGIFGIGGETIGELAMACTSPNEVLDAPVITSEFAGKIIVGGSWVTADAIAKAVKVGVKGIIVGGLDDKDLKDFLGYDLGVAITGNENKGISLVVTEGFGKIGMAAKTFNLLKANTGRKTSINGATQIRAGVIRPEVIIPRIDKEECESKVNEAERGGMTVGSLLRCIREPYFGMIARVVSLPIELTRLESETKVRVVEVAFEDGKKVTLPRANVELIEG
jgi:hypothetical protein